MTLNRVVDAFPVYPVLLTLLVFGLLNWAYVVLIQFFLPYSILTDKLTHLTPWLRVDIFGMVSYVVAGTAFFLLAWRKWK